MHPHPLKHAPSSVQSTPTHICMLKVNSSHKTHTHVHACIQGVERKRRVCCAWSRVGTRLRQRAGMSSAGLALPSGACRQASLCAPCAGRTVLCRAFSASITTRRRQARDLSEAIGINDPAPDMFRSRSVRLWFYSVETPTVGRRREELDSRTASLAPL